MKTRIKISKAAGKYFIYGIICQKISSLIILSTECKQLCSSFSIEPILYVLVSNLHLRFKWNWKQQQQKRIVIKRLRWRQRKWITLFSYKVTLDMGGINCSRRVNQSVIRAGLIHCVTRLTFWKFFCRFCCHEYPRLNQSNCHPFKIKLCVINHMIMPLYTYACGTNMTTIAIHDPRDEINNISQSNLDNLI